MSKTKALVVAADATVRRGKLEVLRSMGLDSTGIADDAQAVQMIRKNPVDIVLIHRPDYEPLPVEMIRTLGEVDPHLQIIVQTNHDVNDTPAEFQPHEHLMILPETSDPILLEGFVGFAIKQRLMSQENYSLQKKLKGAEKGSNSRSVELGEASSKTLDPLIASAELIGVSRPIREVRRQIAEVAQTDMTVLIQGETGTGKDVIARLIHRSSQQAEMGDFIKICCPALPEQLLESELFGHEAGAFTGALQQKPGRLELASEGTAFLDEITEMPLSVQAKLLEVLEHKKFMRVGGTEIIQVNTRIVAATNVPTKELFETARFRADLYFRLNQYTIYMPPLRDRKEDIPVLIDHFLREFAHLSKTPPQPLSAKAMASLMTYTWPGNVRELESVVRRYALTGREDEIRPGLIDHEEAPTNEEPVQDMGTYRESERQVILDALSQTRWNRREASKILGISYNTLRRRITKYGFAEGSTHVTSVALR